ncbi:hypothetical protein ACWEV4_32670 [Streptomyces sp. NPDC003860]
MRTAQILDPDVHLSCTREGVARLCSELAHHVDVLLPIAGQGPFADQAHAAADRAQLLLSQAPSGQATGTVVAVVRCAEWVRELAVLTYRKPDALRAACRPAIAGSAR